MFVCLQRASRLHIAGVWMLRRRRRERKSLNLKSLTTPKAIHRRLCGAMVRAELVRPPLSASGNGAKRQGGIQFV
jgi:hypothetical protein